nr:MAG TPA: hypothetical protein [Caudoviricetes sp.]
MVIASPTTFKLTFFSLSSKCIPFSSGIYTNEPGG